jgi:predicted extracellular nuclease
MTRTTLSSAAALMLLAVISTGAGTVSADTGDPVLINELLASHSGTDDTEFIELYGTPGTSLAGLSVIVVESDAFDPGRIDRRFDFKPFHVLGSNGFFLIGNCAGLPANYGVTPDASLFNNYFENSSLTAALVATSSLSVGEGDLVTGSEVVLDAVALSDGDPGDTFFFDAPVIGPDGPFFPAGARRLVDGVDTGMAADWAIASFFLPGDNTPTGGGFDGCAPLTLSIPEIQGDGRRSLYEGEVVTTTGIVTLVTANGRDMWIQDATGDGDPATSDGIFVDDRDRLDPLPEVGDEVIVTAVVEEQQFGTALPLTRLNNPDDYPFVIVSSGNALPSPVELVDLPNWEMPDGEAFWEPLEGMLVSVTNAFVTAATNRFGEFGMLSEADADADLGSGYFAQTKSILVQSLGGDVVDYNPERIQVDDNTLEEAIQVRPGDRMRHLVGVVDYTFSMYKLQPSSFDVKTNDPGRPPLSKRSGGFGNTTITTFNVENLFDLVDNPDKDDEGSTPTPEELATKLDKLCLAIQVELDLPEILVVQEVENTAILQELGDLVNAAAGTSYVATSFETSDGRGIEVGFLWDEDRVGLVDAYQMAGPGVDMWFGPSSPSPGREPLVGVFDIAGHEVTIVGNHFKSKGGDDPLYFDGTWPPTRITEVQRKGQAGVVRDFVNAILDANPDELVMVTGDLNDFQFSEPGEGPDNPVAILESSYAGSPDEVPLTNLLYLEKAAERFTFVFDGNSQVLDHMLVSPALLGHVVAADILHFNTTVPAVFEDDATTPLKASDHDPLEGRFKFR